MYIDKHIIMVKSISCKLKDFTNFTQMNFWSMKKINQNKKIMLIEFKKKDGLI